MSDVRADVVIVGGGLVGCAAALHLRERGASVAVVEKNQLGAAASGVNFGGVRRNGRKLAELGIAARALAIWKHLPELVGSDCESTKLRATSGRAQRRGFEPDRGPRRGQANTGSRFRCWAATHCSTVTRGSARAPWAAAYCASDGQANPRLVGPAFARAARAAGATLIEHDGAQQSSATAADSSSKPRPAYAGAGAS